MANNTATPESLTEMRRQMVLDMHNQAAAWRALAGKNAHRVVFVDKDQRLLWLVDGHRYVGMQISTSGRPLVMASSGLTKGQLDGAIIAFDLCWDDLLRRFKPQEFGHYCELAAKGCESAAQYLEEMLQGGAQ